MNDSVFVVMHAIVFSLYANMIKKAMLKR